MNVIDKNITENVLENVTEEQQEINSSNSDIEIVSTAVEVATKT